MDTHDAAALEHYHALIAQHYPPHLAAVLVAARYAHGLAASNAPLPIPALRDAVAQAQDAYPDLSRDAGRLRDVLDKRIGVPTTKPRRT
jgi:hypothetical protein